MKKLIAAGIFHLILAAGPATAEEPVENPDPIVSMAQEYLAAYSTFEPDKMAPFYADDAVFHDPTSTVQNAQGGAFYFEGKSAILKGLGDYAAQFKRFSVHYDISQRYESNGVVVFIAELTYEGESPGGETFKGSAPIVTVVSVKDGKIVRHTDYFDYKENAVAFSAE